jgi:hypothetical protein
VSEVKESDGDIRKEWRDVRTDGTQRYYGPGTKAQAAEVIADLRRLHPTEVYRTVKLGK